MPAFLHDLWRLAREITTPFLVYQITASVFVAFSLVNATVDWFVFRRPRVQPALTPGPSPNSGRGESELTDNVSGSGTVTEPRDSPLSQNWERGAGGVRAGTNLPSLSILIPARNEEAVIGACVQSLLTNGYSGKLEVLVLDDRSDDRTGEIVAGIAATDNRVRLLTGGELLPGWKGKPNALRQLASAATGEMLLLTDADCTFYPDALAAAVRHRETMRTDCLSLCPDLTCKTFWEHVILPLQYFLVFTTLPIWAVYATRNPAFAAANGAFILLPATLYSELGGHEPVKNEMAEDIKFSQHVKRSGYRLVYGDGSTTYAVRMYESLRGIWDGFSKNIYSAMGRSLLVVVFWSAFQFLTQILPFGFLTVALATGNRSLVGFWLPLAHVAIAFAIRIALAIRFRQALWAVLLHPIGWLITVAMCWNSTYLALSGKGHAWKGRVYQN